MKNNHLGQELSMVNVLKRSFPGEDKVKQSEVHKKVEEISDRFYWQLPSQRQNIAFLYLCISKVVLSVYPSILLWILISSFFFFFFHVLFCLKENLVCLQVNELSTFLCLWPWLYPAGFTELHLARGLCLLAFYSANSWFSWWL